jgi:hypothetical protein
MLTLETPEGIAYVAGALNVCEPAATPPPPKTPILEVPIAMI